MKKYTLILITYLISSYFFQSSVRAWDNEKTHKQLTDYAAKYSCLAPGDNDFLKLLGFKDGLGEGLAWKGQVCNDKAKDKACTVNKWLTYGAEKEDAEVYFPLVDFSLRFLNHFHDPLSGEGLHDGIASGQSALEWAQDGYRQSRAVEGDQSWATLRTLYFEALTADSEAKRQEQFSKLFKGLGHQMHLVQDMAVPAHVRNDAHPADALQEINRSQWNDYPHYPLFFESWAKKHEWIIANLASNAGQSFIPEIDYNTPYAGNGTLLPISQLWDANQYVGTNPSAALNQGLSEYTNANFFSDDTIFADQLKPDDPHYFPFPATSSTNIGAYEDLLPIAFVGDDGKVRFKLYLAKEGDGETLEPFLRVGYFYRQLSRHKVAYRRTIYLDDECHLAYAKKLVPRAVGHSTALLNYFFRGSMDVKALPIFIDNKLLLIRLSITNTTVTRETMRAGTFSLALRYRPREADADGSQDIFLSAVEPKPIPELRFKQTTKFDFYFNYTKKIPLELWDTMQATLVFAGTLGQEPGAVAGRVFTPGRIMFNEEWDNDLTGNNPWYSSVELQDNDLGVVTRNVEDGMFTMKCLRNGKSLSSWGNVLSVDLADEESEGLLIGPDGHLQMIIPQMTTVFEEEDPPCHVVEFIFNNKMALQYSATSSFLSGSTKTICMSFNPLMVISDNIHGVFNSVGIRVREPLYLKRIQLLQLVPPGLSGKFSMEMYAEAIRIIDSATE